MSVAGPHLRLPELLVEKVVAEALAEDLGEAGDITTVATVAPGARASGAIAARKPGVVAGLQIAEAAFRALDENVVFEVLIRDGERVQASQQIVRVAGDAGALLTAERVALNFLGHMSGIATLTSSYTDKISGTRAKIIDTRKTTPGLRAIEKLAVRAGGDLNHRFGLLDAGPRRQTHVDRELAGVDGGKELAARAEQEEHRASERSTRQRQDEVSTPDERRKDAVKHTRVPGIPPTGILVLHRVGARLEEPDAERGHHEDRHHVARPDGEDDREGKRREEELGDA